MIFKLKFTNKDYRYTMPHYISVCAKKVLGEHRVLHSDLYNDLKKRKLFSLPITDFDFKITNYLRPYTIDCGFRNGNIIKVFCTLEELSVPIVETHARNIIGGYTSALIKKYGITPVAEPSLINLPINPTIQPMTVPTGAVFYLDYVYGQNTRPNNE